MSSKTSDDGPGYRSDLRIPWDRSDEIVPVEPAGAVFGADSVVPVPRPKDGISPIGFWLLSAVLAGALLLRLPALGTGLWIDEIQTWLGFVTLQFHEIPFALESQNNHVFYTLLAKASMVVFGYTAWALRFPAVLLGVAGVYAVYQLGREVGGEREAILAAALTAASSHHVFFSQNGRGYTGLFLFATLAATLLIRLLRRTRRDDPNPVKPASLGVTLTAYVLVLFLGAWCHLTAGAVIAVHGVVGLWVYLRGTHRSVIFGATVAAGLLIVLVTLPGLPSFLEGLGGAESTAIGGEIEWSSFGWLVAETIRGLSSSVPGGLVGLGVVAGVGTLGLVSVARQHPLATAAMLLPGGIILGLLVATGHNLWPRFFFFSGGYAIVFGVRGVMKLFQVNPGSSWRSKVPGVPARAATFVLWVAVAGSALTVPRIWGPKQDFEGARDRLEARAGGNVTVAVLPWAGLALLEYLEVEGTDVRTLEVLESLERPGTTVQAVYTFPEYIQTATPDLWARLDEEYTVVHVLPGTVSGGEIVILEREIAAETTAREANSQ